ncbi:NAD-dependent epimerase/dehydratase family protein [Neobacillus sp. NRS-1170]|uniref:NAD-dependent epimerase/dehydratase family protein n=1 Tax=Neobacillus sp. NRS-1170 TaxID=3233898 RepID=UPI003D2999FD
MKVLVTGGAGFIGSHVTQLLIELGYEVLVVDYLQSGNRDTVPLQARFYNVDITSSELEPIFEKEKPEIVIHLAAQVDVTRSIDNPFEDASSNILGTIRLLTCCHKFNIKKLIFSSSCAVYGEQNNCSVKENFRPKPLSFYGISKYTSELYIQTFNNLYQIPYTILRYANVYGPRQTPKGEGGVISTFFNKVLKGEAPFIFGDGEQTRDFIYVKDVSLANVLSIDYGTNETFNIGSNTKTSINELYQMISEISSCNIPPISMPERNGDIRNSCLDNTKAANLLNWKPSIDIQTGLRETFNYYKTAL